MSLSTKDQLRTIQCRIRNDVEQIKKIEDPNISEKSSYYHFRHAIGCLKDFDYQITLILEALDD